MMMALDTLRYTGLYGSVRLMTVIPLSDRVLGVCHTRMEPIGMSPAYLQQYSLLLGHNQ